MHSVGRAFGWLFGSWQAFLIVLALTTAANTFLPGSALGVLSVIFSSILSAVWLVRLLRWSLRRILWRVRNRLIVSYALIAAIPFVLVALLAALAYGVFAIQVAGFTANMALDRRAAILTGFVNVVQLEGPYNNTLSKLATLQEKTTPQIQVVVEERGRRYTYPTSSTLVIPPGLPSYGIIEQPGADGERTSDFYLFAQNVAPDRKVFAIAPVDVNILSELVASLGEVKLVSARMRRTRIANAVVQLDGNTAPSISAAGTSRLPRTNREPRRSYKPQRTGFLDFPAPSLSERVVWLWSEKPREDRAVLVVDSSTYAVLQMVSRQGIDNFGDFFPGVLSAVGAVFFFLAGIAVIIGVTLTRSITNAVQEIYEGTEHVMRGDFSHRIAARGKDQLGDLGRSFNRMTENLENLVVVAKEKERLQAELEIAREVQNQLFPRTIPKSPKLVLKALCNPARLVSGDYYDFQQIDPQNIAVAVGDVSGKGISAALLMATLQSSFRSQLRFQQEAAKAEKRAGCAVASTSAFVSAINKHVYSTTPPEKFATFFFGTFNDENSRLTYTNAGHLPPMLLRDGQTSRLEVNGLIVGAFPFAKYEESCVDLQPGDLLVCFTDGVSEPENEFGEMFGEDRLAQLLLKNLHKTDDQILEVVLDAIEQWTKSKVLQDDITLVIARHL